MDQQKSERKFRQLKRRLEVQCRRCPDDEQAKELLSCADELATMAMEDRRRAEISEGRLSQFEETTADQLAETRVDLENARTRSKRLEKALDETVKIAKKDRTAGWKKVTNPDFQRLCECEDLLADRHEAEKEEAFQERVKAG